MRFHMVHIRTTAIVTMGCFLLQESSSSCRADHVVFGPRMPRCPDPIHSEFIRIVITRGINLHRATIMLSNSAPRCKWSQKRLQYCLDLSWSHSQARWPGTAFLWPSISMRFMSPGVTMSCRNRSCCSSSSARSVGPG